MKREDYIGQKFHKLTIIDYKRGQPKSKNCQCKCDCGNTIWARYGNLKQGNNKGCGCLGHRYDNRKYIGQKFNNLTIIDYKKNQPYNNNCQCRCDCGNIVWIRYGNLKNGLNKTCSSSSCLYHLKLSRKRFDNNTINNFKSLLQGKIPLNYTHNVSFHKKFLSILKGAKARNLSVTMSQKYMEDIYDEQKGLCAITKIPLDNSTASLDRIDSNKGYINGNIQWVHSIINVLKLNFDQSYFVDMCKKVSDHKNKPLNYINSFNKYTPINKTTYKGELKRSVWNTIVKKSHRRNIPFDPLFTPEDAEEIFVKQNGLCAISGIPIPLRPFKSYKKLTASLDRINSFLGYTKNNVQWVHKHINLMKSKLDEETFLLLCNVVNKNFV